MKLKLIAALAVGLVAASCSTSYAASFICTTQDKTDSVMLNTFTMSLIDVDGDTLTEQKVYENSDKQMAIGYYDREKDLTYVVGYAPKDHEPLIVARINKTSSKDTKHKNVVYGCEGAN
ncbi:TPA: hypothetical protein GM645_00040 [Klebsiella pneumoniae]|nr:hypothetical protein [Klebsiella pneumoniae]HBX0707457.1 hypothetical protein [Klebsiella pneumoniae]HCB0969497.1 hypothetical protein [Klebsiella pneumoniae]HCB1251199.1 hypothetical protein [Klebsiella pneumoniae]